MLSRAHLNVRVRGVEIITQALKKKKPEDVGMSKIPWAVTKTNKNTRREAGPTKSLQDRRRKSQATFYVQNKKNKRRFGRSYYN